MKLLSGLVHIDGNLLCAVDVETTGRQPGFHEIIQIGIQPLNSRIEPMDDVLPFYQYIKPDHPERVDRYATAVHRLSIDWLVQNAPDRWTVEELLEEMAASEPLPEVAEEAPPAPSKKPKKDELPKDPHGRQRALISKYNAPTDPRAALAKGRGLLLTAKDLNEWQEICEAFCIPGSVSGRWSPR